MPTYDRSGQLGYLVQVAQALATSLSQSRQVQLWLGVADEATALPLITLWSDDPPADAEEYDDAEQAARLPLVMIDWAEGHQANLQNPTQWRSSGSLLVLMQRVMTAPEQADPDGTAAALLQTYGELIAELWDASQAGATFIPRGFHGGPIGLLDPDERGGHGELAQISFQARWGTQR